MHKPPLTNSAWPEKQKHNLSAGNEVPLQTFPWWKGLYHLDAKASR